MADYNLLGPLFKNPKVEQEIAEGINSIHLNPGAEESAAQQLTQPSAPTPELDTGGMQMQDPTVTTSFENGAPVAGQEATAQVDQSTGIVHEPAPAQKATVSDGSYENGGPVSGESSDYPIAKRQGTLPEAKQQALEGEVLPSDSLANPKKSMAPEAEDAMYGTSTQAPNESFPLAERQSTLPQEQMLPSSIPTKMPISKQRAIAALIGGGTIGAAYMASRGGGGSGNPPNGPTPSGSTTGLPKNAAAQAPAENGLVAQQTKPSEAHKTSGVTPIAPEVQGSTNSSDHNTMDMPPVDPLNTVEGLREVQGRQNNAVFGNQLGRAADLIGAGIAGHGAKPVAQDIFNDQIKEAGNITKQFAEQVDQQKNDPHSQISQDMRDYAHRILNINLPLTTSAASVEKGMPYLFKQFEASAAQKAKSDDLKYKYKELTAMKEIAGNQKLAADQGKNDIKQMADLGKITKEMNPGTASSRSPLGQSTIILNKADRIDALLDQMKKAQAGGSPQQAKEAARQLDSMLSGGMGSVSGSHDLFTRTGAGDIANFLQYVTNSPQGSNNQDFIKQMKDTIDRERAVAKKQQRDFLSSTAMGNAERFKTGKTADTWRRITSNAGLDEDGNPMDQQALVQGQIPQGGQMQSGKMAPDDNGAPGRVVQEQQRFAQPGQQAPAPKAPPAGKIKVSNGTKSLYIDPQDLPHALASGYSKVQ